MGGDGEGAKGQGSNSTLFPGFCPYPEPRDELGSFLGLPITVRPFPPSRRLALRGGCSWLGRPWDPHSRAPRWAASSIAPTGPGVVSDRLVLVSPKARGCGSRLHVIRTLISLQPRPPQQGHPEGRRCW